MDPALLLLGLDVRLHFLFLDPNSRTFTPHEHSNASSATCVNALPERTERVFGLLYALAAFHFSFPTDIPPSRGTPIISHAPCSPCINSSPCLDMRRMENGNWYANAGWDLGACTV